MPWNNPNKEDICTGNSKLRKGEKCEGHQAMARLSCSWTVRVDTVKVAILSRAILRRIPAHFLAYVEQTILKFTWKYARPRRIKKRFWTADILLETALNQISSYATERCSGRNSMASKQKSDMWIRGIALKIYNNSVHRQPPDFWQRRQKYTLERR